MHKCAILGFERGKHALTHRNAGLAHVTKFALSLAGFVYELESRFYVNFWNVLTECPSTTESKEIAQLCHPVTRQPYAPPRLKDEPPPDTAAADLRPYWGEIWHSLLEMACVWDAGYTAGDADPDGFTGIYQSYSKRAREREA
jgi:hypothetical protein